nr:hypothetical protein CFP56_18751 [Quercus suber]
MYQTLCKVLKFFVSCVRVGGRPAFGFGISLSQVSRNVEGRGGSLAESVYKGEGRDGIIVGGRDEIRGRSGDVESGRGESNSRMMEFSKLAEIFIAVISQSTAAAIAIDLLGQLSRASHFPINFIGFVCCTAALWQRHANPTAARILGKIGSVASALGLILMIAMILPVYLLWMIGLACLVLLVIFTLSFGTRT